MILELSSNTLFCSTEKIWLFVQSFLWAYLSCVCEQQRLQIPEPKLFAYGIINATFWNGPAQKLWY